MISFSKKEDYSLIILSKLASNYHVRLTSLSEISKEYKISIFFLRNLANTLRKAKFIGAKEGKTGGYFLLRNSKNIKIREVLNAFSKKPILECLDNDFRCPKKSFCKTSSAWRKISSEFMEKISKLSLHDFLNYK